MVVNMLHFRSRTAALPAALTLLVLLAGPAGLRAQHVSKVEKLFDALAWRAIGPAVMGGRTVDIGAVESDPAVIYAAVGPSGVWKSENAGTSWLPVFQNEPTVSVGAVAVAQSNPSIVWAGSGEATCRNSVTIGDGVYKSTDGGKTWKNMGLADTRHISRIVINMGDPNIVYIAAMGHLWGPNQERGLYKTIDGGLTWTKVLYIDENTGVCDLAVDPADSQVVYAAAYEHRRKPWEYVNAGPSSGLWKSSDGGRTWKKLGGGLPEGTLGRIGIAVARSKPGVVYALVEHSDPGIWRSEDRGETWKRMCDAETFRRVNNRPFYYSRVFVDPTDDATIYVLSTGLFVSKDMGRNFRALGGGIHSDHHGFWIDPADPKHLIDGNDGGIDISFDAGRTWLPVQSMDAAEVYNVGYDLRDPYYIYVGLQDNGSWGGPSNSLDTRGILNEHWHVVGGGDGFYVKPDPADYATVYANSQMNGITKVDLRLGRGKSVRPQAPAGRKPYRFNWNSPILISPHDPKTVYTAGNFLFRTTDGGRSWEVISPDLTTDDPAKQKNGVGPLGVENSGAEVHCTIVTVAESPLEKGLIWCGTDDGNLQLTRDGGRSWKNVAPSIPGLTRNAWCSRVEASRFEAGTAYVSFDNHRQDDYRPYIYKTADYGRTWKPIHKGLPEVGWVHVVREDTRNRNLLFAGTEFGVFASLDGGASWFPLRCANLPTVAVHDIAVHPRENDLIIGTHGRGVWILDDISFLQEMSERVLASDLHLFSLRPVVQFASAARGEGLTKSSFSGRNPAFGLNITAWIKNDLAEKPKLAVLDADGRVVHEFVFSEQKAGLRRQTWNLQFVPEASDGRKYQPTGMAVTALPMIAPAKYTLILSPVPDGTRETPFEVKPDPRVDFSLEVWHVQCQAFGELLKLTRQSNMAVTALRGIRRHLDRLMAKSTEDGTVVSSALKELDNKLKPLEKELLPPDLGMLNVDYETALSGGPYLIRLLTLGSSLIDLNTLPTEMELRAVKEFSDRMSGSLNKLNADIIDALPALNELLKKSGFQPFTTLTKIDLLI